ncbi:hypothetical protein VFPPC_06466 [Pochonia chlamydosporia 170]|uniref:Rhodopsin domain-containing protein n=1 Tax=Pochonia chlamydosporia 170 TaxID=1380566 RepID=A0A179FJB2_METCM|nr:hypothetical protein VFPPC_06466 [Pochonia chlamydosporia 170]OAQ65351.2 hypothetical protein VFPPC_06466 [Pochonia chlamydosporia 170]
MERPPPPAGVDLSEDRRATIVATSVVTWFLAIIAIILRLLSRRMKGIELWLDDWLIIAALFPSCAHVFGMAGYAVSRGLGQHIWVTPPDSTRAWALGLFIAELGYFFTLICVKWSILAFYWRSFHIRRSIRIPIWTLATVVLLWGIAVILVTIFQCQPTHAFWSRFDPVNPRSPSDYHCGVEDTKFFYGNAIPTIITDILMLLLPAPYIYTLQLRKGQKFALAGIFLVGLFVTLVSVIRLNYLLKGNLQDPDITWNFVDIGLWSVIEGNIAMVCACLPFLRPILNKLTFGIFNISSVGSKPHHSSNFIKVSHNNASSHRWDDIGRSGRTSATVKAKGDV